MNIQTLSPEQEIKSAIKRSNTLLIDFDGTLVDYHQGEREALVKLLRENDIAPRFYSNAVKLYKKTNMSLWEKFEKGEILPDEIRYTRFNVICKEYNINLNPMEMNNAYLNYFIEYTTVEEDVLKSLEKLREDDIKLIIVTNGTDYVQRERVKITGIDEFIDDIVTSDGIGSSKPDSKIYKAALNLAKSNYKRSWMIGDSMTSDIPGANLINMKSCLITNSKKFDFSSSKYQPDITSPDFSTFTNYYLKMRNL